MLVQRRHDKRGGKEAHTATVSASNLSDVGTLRASSSHGPQLGRRMSARLKSVFVSRSRCQPI